VNNELKGMWKEVSMTLFQIISRQLPGGIEKKHDKHRSEYSTSQERFWSEIPKISSSIAI